MSEPDLVEMLCLDAGLRQPQAEGVLGFLLQNLQTRLSPDAYDAVAAIIPNPEHCLECAPTPGAGSWEVWRPWVVKKPGCSWK